MKPKKYQHTWLHLLCLGAMVLVIFIFLTVKTKQELPLSAQEKIIQQQIQETNYCQTAQDCAVLEGKCPFGCYITINKAEVTKLKLALEAYQTQCIYSCIALDGVVCQNNKCAPVIAGDVLVPSGNEA